MASADRAQLCINARKGDPAPPASLRRLSIVKEHVAGFDCYTVSPANNDRPDQAVLYLHGGAFFSEIRREHWNFIARLVEETNCRAYVPIYGLAPAYTFQEAFPFLIAVYKMMLGSVPSHRITVMGDSAGGGMSVSLAQSLLEAKLPQPSKLVLLAPWLDLALADPEISEIEKRDPWLSKVGLLVAAKAWAAGEDLTNPHLSPIHGSLKGLPPIDIYVGTNDILVADCRTLRDLAAKDGIRVDYEESAGAFHVYPLAPVPEGRSAAGRIIDRLSLSQKPATHPQHARVMKKTAMRI